MFGVQSIYGAVGMVAWLVVFNWAVLPIFHDLQLMTLYQVRRAPVNALSSSRPSSDLSALSCAVPADAVRPASPHVRLRVLLHLFGTCCLRRDALVFDCPGFTKYVTLQLTWLPIVIYVPALAFNQGSCMTSQITDYSAIAANFAKLTTRKIILRDF